MKSGAGVLGLCDDYQGDIMNFDMVADLAALGGMSVQTRIATCQKGV